MSDESLDMLSAKKARLVQQKDAIDTELAPLRARLTEIKGNAVAFKQYANPREFAELTERVASLGRQSQICQRQLSVVNQRIKQVNKAASLKQKADFQEIAREMLDPDTYQAILKEMSFRQNYVLSDTPRSALVGVGSAVPVRGTAPGVRTRE